MLIELDKLLWVDGIILSIVMLWWLVIMLLMLVLWLLPLFGVVLPAIIVIIVVVVVIMRKLVAGQTWSHNLSLALSCGTKALETPVVNRMHVCWDQSDAVVKGAVVNRVAVVCPG